MSGAQGYVGVLEGHMGIIKGLYKVCVYTYI